MSDLKDPRVLFAAERTLLPWNRTSISLMAFGFVVERFGLFLEVIDREEVKVFQRHVSFFVGLSFILLAAFVALYSAWQHGRILRMIRPTDIPEGYKLYTGITINTLLGLLAIAMCIYMTLSFI